jgi:uncharacterized membrane protein YccF (DUF307 family)
VRVLLNLIWLVFGRLLLALGYAIVALVMFILIVTIPFASRLPESLCSVSGRSAARLFDVRMPGPAL